MIFVLHSEMSFWILSYVSCINVHPCYCLCSANKFCCSCCCQFSCVFVKNNIYKHATNLLYIVGAGIVNFCHPCHWLKLIKVIKKPVHLRPSGKPWSTSHNFLVFMKNVWFCPSRENPLKRHWKKEL